MKKQGLYLPEFEHENCGAGFICNLNGEKTNQIIHDALEILVKLEHRGRCKCRWKNRRWCWVINRYSSCLFQTCL